MGETQSKTPFWTRISKTRALARIKKRLFWHPHSPIEEEIINLAVQQVIQRSLARKFFGIR